MEDYKFKSMFKFLKDFGFKKYQRPEKAGKDMHQMQKIANEGNMLCNSFHDFCIEVAQNTQTLEYAGPRRSWLLGNGTTIRNYFWVELKNSKWSSSQISVSLSISSGNEIEVRVELHDDKASDEEALKLFRLLDLNLQKDTFYRVFYRDKRPTMDYYAEQAEILKSNKTDPNISKIQVIKYVEDVVEKEKDGNLLKAVVNTVNEIYPYYEHVMSDESVVKNSGNSKVANIRYWLYSPGENASNWDELYDAGIMGVGWDLIGDLRKYDSQDDIDNALLKIDDSNASQKINAKALWQFANDMKPGDIVFAKKGTGLIIGKGIVKSDYLFDDDRTELKHVRKIDWTNKGEWENPGSAIRKTLTELTPHEAGKLNALFKDDLKFKNVFSRMLYESKNLILRGAPGTGKSYLAKEIAADIITNGQLIDGKPIKFAELTDEQKKQVAFVQFHPNYDYSDFVEGLRPVKNDDGTMCFDLKDGVFKVFVDQARKNYEDSLKTLEDIEKESSIQEAINQFLLSLDNKHSFKTISGTEFEIEKFDDERIYINVPQNQSTKLTVRVDEVKKMLESDVNFTMIKDVTSFFGKTFAKQAYSYNFAIYKAIMDKKASLPKTPAKQTELKKYVFIIDEINRGEISKIFGELFYSIDPGYRGRDGEIFTQYSNMHSDPNEKFYIPDNVYIIGTMNDIDRSVDSFDFAMRRRFRFVELKASEQLKMLDSLNDDAKKEEAKHRMEKLNKAIVKEKELNENYQIGAAYFLKLKYLSFDRLWTDYLEPLLHEYVRGMYDESDIMKRLADAYGYKNSTEGDADESDQN